MDRLKLVNLKKRVLIPRLTRSVHSDSEAMTSSNIWWQAGEDPAKFRRSVFFKNFPELCTSQLSHPSFESQHLTSPERVLGIDWLYGDHGFNQPPRPCSLADRPGVGKNEEKLFMKKSASTEWFCFDKGSVASKLQRRNCEVNNSTARTWAPSASFAQQGSPEFAVLKAMSRCHFSCRTRNQDDPSDHAVLVHGKEWKPGLGKRQSE